MHLAPDWHPRRACIRLPTHLPCISQVLLRAMEAGVQFRVIIADAGPKFEGRELMRRLLASGIRCTYVNLHALPYMISEVSKLLLGASS